MSMLKSLFFVSLLSSVTFGNMSFDLKLYNCKIINSGNQQGNKSAEVSISGSTGFVYTFRINTACLDSGTIKAPAVCNYSPEGYTLGFELKSCNYPLQRCVSDSSGVRCQ